MSLSRSFWVSTIWALRSAARVALLPGFVAVRVIVGCPIDAPRSNRNLIRPPFRAGVQAPG